MTKAPVDARAATAVTPGWVMERLRRPTAAEWAFLDLREVGEAAEGHPFASTNVPYSRLEMSIERLVPRRATPLVLIDAGDGVAQRAARRLFAMGWQDLAIVTGGVPGWQAADCPLFKGVHTFSKAFGEWVQHRFDVPEIGPEDLAARLAGADAPVLIDGRPAPEHRAFTLPGALNCPNAELALRLDMALPAGGADRAEVVVHCAGRTRSIIGAQTLRDFGLPVRAVALRDGTQGWELSGRARDYGAQRTLPDPGAPPPDALARAGAVIAREGLATITPADLGNLVAQDTQTLYLLDPRAEDAPPPPPGFVRAPGTTLVQQTDQYVAVKGAVVVVWDPALVRAVFAALWLTRMGIDARILTAPAPVPARMPVPLPHDEMAALDHLDADALALAIGQGAVVLDTRAPSAYRAGHIKGARRVVRPKIMALGLSAPSRILLVADDASLAGLVAADLADLGHVVVGITTSGPDAWRAVGLGVDAQSGMPDLASDPDVVAFCAGRHTGNLDDARAYLAWETGLLDRLASAGLTPWPASAPITPIHPF